MKLIDLLARELESWPECACICQDGNGEVYGWTGEPIWQKYEWLIAKGADVAVRRPVDIDLASDHSTAIITRSDWQSASDKLKGESEMQKPKGNKDGWVRHRGGKCPVALAHLVEVKYRNGTIDSDHIAGELSWVHYGETDDIMAYRIHAPEQQSVNITMLDTGAAWQMLDNPAEPNEALKAILALDAPMPAAKYFDGPLQWRDRIKEIGATIVVLEDERGALIQRLADEGLALLRVDPIKAEDSAKGLDMVDWRNWLPGDLVECVHTKDSYPAVLTIGKLYTVRNHEGAVEDDEGDQMMYCTRARCFKWHSRPSKP